MVYLGGSHLLGQELKRLMGTRVLGDLQELAVNLSWKKLELRQSALHIFRSQ